MTQILVNLVTQYPGVLYILIGAVIFFIVIAILSFRQGRSFKTPFLEFGKREKNESDAAPRKEQPIISQSPSIQQSPAIHINTSAMFTSEQIEVLAQKVAETTHKIQREVDNKPPDILYHPPVLSERIVYIYSARHDIESRIKHIYALANPGGGWAGISMAQFEKFFELVQTQGRISQELAQSISHFWELTHHLLQNNLPFTDDKFLQIQYLSFHINSELVGIESRFRREG